MQECYGKNALWKFSCSAYCFFFSVFVLYLFPDFGPPHTVQLVGTKGTTAHLSHTEHAAVYEAAVSLQMNIIHTMHSSLNGHFFGSYSFNLFYLFILVMRNNIMIVDPSFFWC